MNDKSVLSLFTGCGGLDIGFEGNFTTHINSINNSLHPYWIEKLINKNWGKLQSNSFKIVFANDINPLAKIAWVNYFKKHNYNDDIYHVESIVDIVKNRKYLLPRNVDVVTGGFPCQDFSVAGKRNGFESHKSHTGTLRKFNEPTVESRGQLYIWMKEVIEITKPKIFIAENVKGLANLSNVKEIIQNDFSKISGNGYIVVPPKVLHASNYGIPQTRERVIFIGIRKDILLRDALNALSSEIIPSDYDPYPLPTHYFNGIAKTDELRAFLPVQDVLFDLEEPEYALNDMSQQYYSKAKYYGSHVQGQTEINMNKPGPTIRAEHHGNIEFRRLSLKHGGKYINELNSGLKERRLTLRECARIQTFPDDFEFVLPSNSSNSRFSLSPSQGYRLVGNAVPPLLGYHIAKRIEELWKLYFGSD